jgi:hypothetical protein
MGWNDVLSDTDTTGHNHIRGDHSDTSPYSDVTEVTQVRDRFSKGS